MQQNNKTIQAFGEDHVIALTGLSKNQLRSWDKGGFFQPDYAYGVRRAPYSRVYSFRDVVGLRMIARLMKDYGVSLHQLRRVAKELVTRGYEHWADLRLYVVKGEVHFRGPASLEVEGVFSGQYAMLPVLDVIEEITREVQKLKERSKEDIGKIERSKFVARNSEVVSGTRIPVATVRRFLEAGYSVNEILAEYPQLTKRDIEAACAREKIMDKFS